MQVSPDSLHVHCSTALMPLAMGHGMALQCTVLLHQWHGMQNYCVLWRWWQCKHDHHGSASMTIIRDDVVCAVQMGVECQNVAVSALYI